MGPQWTKVAFVGETAGRGSGFIPSSFILMEGEDEPKSKQEPEPEPEPTVVAPVMEAVVPAAQEAEPGPSPRSLDMDEYVLVLSPSLGSAAGTAAQTKVEVSKERPIASTAAPIPEGVPPLAL